MSDTNSIHPTQHASQTGQPMRFQNTTHWTRIRDLSNAWSVHHRPPTKPTHPFAHFLRETLHVKIPSHLSILATVQFSLLVRNSSPTRLPPPAASGDSCHRQTTSSEDNHRECLHSL